MKSVQSYASLDLSDGSETVRALIGAAPDEAGQSSISISGARNSFDARQPAGLTPRMIAWYASNVSNTRLAAISEVRDGFENDKPGLPKSLYLEAERDIARRKGVVDAIAQAERFTQQNQKLLAEHNQAESDFATLRARLDRDPVRFAGWLYALLLIGIILLEAAINFESFLRVPYITSPFLATGATLAVGLGIGFAAHFHGIVLKQWHFLFSPQEAGDPEFDGRKSDAIKRLIFGGVLLGVALLMVAGSRYYYLIDNVMRARILGLAPPSLFGGIIFMLLGNIVAYAVGVLLAYSTHDAHPAFAARDRALRKSTKEIEKLKKQRTAALKQIRDGTDNRVMAASNQEKITRGPRYAELREAANLIANKDQQVIGVLHSYRNALFSALGERAERTRFHYPDGGHLKLLPDGTDDVLTAERYASLPIELGFTSGDNQHA